MICSVNKYNPNRYQSCLQCGVYYSTGHVPHLCLVLGIAKRSNIKSCSTRLRAWIHQTSFSMRHCGDVIDLIQLIGHVQSVDETVLRQNAQDLLPHVLSIFQGHCNNTEETLSNMFFVISSETLNIFCVYFID